MSESSKRLHYIDWLRVLAVLLLFPFHTGRVFNYADPFYVKSAATSLPLGLVLGFIDVWHMPLLFLLAGASTYFALGKRSLSTYAGERVKRLLVPFVFGVFVLIPPQTWFGGRFNSGYAESYWHYLSTGAFLVPNIRGGADYYGGLGFGHLWFILWLFLISLAAIPFLAWARGRGAETVAKWSRALTRPVWWLVPAIAILFGEALPDIIEGKNPFYFLAFFLLGYVSMADPSFAEAAERHRWPALLIGLAASVFWLLTGPLRDSLPDPSLPLVGLVILGSLGKWIVIVGMLGMGRRHLDRPSPALGYLAEASYPIYILHQTVIVIAAFYLVRLVAPWPALWLLLLLVAVAATFGLYEVVRRVAPLRVLFGMKPTARR